jgi:hypothetical protein
MGLGELLLGVIEAASAVMTVFEGLASVASAVCMVDKGDDTVN